MCSFLFPCLVHIVSLGWVSGLLALGKVSRGCVGEKLPPVCNIGRDGEESWELQGRLVEVTLTCNITMAHLRVLVVGIWGCSWGYAGEVCRTSSRYALRGRAEITSCVYGDRLCLSFNIIMRTARHKC